MIKPKTLRASVLPTVLVVGTLMLLAVFALLGLLDIETTLYHGNRARKQKEAWLESAFLLWERDSTLLNRLDQEGVFLLFEDDKQSRVTLSTEYWGLYERVQTSTDDGKIQKVRLMGAATESRHGAVLYVLNNRRAFTLTGKTDIRGTVYVPDNGVLYGQVNSDFFQGRPLDESVIRQSTEQFPETNSDLLRSLSEVRMMQQVEPYSYVPTRRSFLEPTLYVECSDFTGADLQGNIVVYSQSPVRIDSTARLEDVLLVAPAVTIGEGFSGLLQVLAGDSVVVKPRVTLKYPSGIILPAAGRDAFIRIEENAEVNGYAVVKLAGELPRNSRHKHYHQDEKGWVRGLVWTDGIAEVHGTVTGSFYVNQSNYYTPQGFYNNLLYNTLLYENRAMGYPLWMGGHYRRKTVKWLD